MNNTQQQWIPSQNTGIGAGIQDTVPVKVAEIPSQVRNLQCQIERFNEVLTRHSKRLEPISFVPPQNENKQPTGPPIQRTMLGKELSNATDMLSHLVSNLEKLTDCIEL